MTEVEAKILKARNSGLSFCQIEEGLIRATLDQVMLRGAAIYGCPLPQTEFFAGYIASELQILIKDFGFEELTEEEILLALRLNYCGGVKFPSGVEIEKITFSGNTFNIFFIASVLEMYMKLRNILDRKCENLIDGYE